MLLIPSTNVKIIKGEDLKTLQPIPRHKGGESCRPWSLEEGGSRTAAGSSVRAWNGLEDPENEPCRRSGLRMVSGRLAALFPMHFACPSVLGYLLCPGPVLDAEGGLWVWP